ncbi:TPA: hypothetical protein EYP37_07705 [Candidatus Poribacteria bacterium]|nr:hypothetical protein [Candidatus Poribacteria bacterium]
MRDKGCDISEAAANHTGQRPNRRHNYADDLPRPSRQGGPIIPENAQEQDWRDDWLIQDLGTILTGELTTMEAPFLYP